MSQNFLVSETCNCKGIVNPEYPNNFDDAKLLNFIGGITGIMPFVPIVPVVGGSAVSMLVNVSGVGNNISNSYTDSLTFTNENRRSGGIKHQFKVNAMERDNGKTDILIKIRNTYVAPYEDEEGLEYWDPVASLFQDRTIFTIKPSNPSLFEVNSDSIFPITNQNTANYSNSVSWGGGVGFTSSGEANTSVNFSVTSGSEISVQDFKITKFSDLSSSQVTWSSEMKNAYDGTSAHLYNSADPKTLVINGALSKWLKRPSDAAMTDLDLEYIAGFSSVDSDLKSKRVEFDFSAVQRLMHIEIVGRTGFKFARTGGVGTEVPYIVKTSGTLIVDLEKGTAEVSNLVAHGLNMRQINEVAKQEPPAPVETKGKLYSRDNLNSLWEKAPDQGGTVIAVATMQDGTILAVGTDQKLYTRANLDSRWLLTPDMGGLVTNISIMQDGTILAVGTDQTLYTRANLDSRWVKAPDMGGIITAVCVMKDGTILAIGTDQKLYTRNNLDSSWVKAPDMGGLVTDVCIMPDGTILAIGTDQKLYTRADLNSHWLKAPDMGGLISGVTVMQDGTILAVGT